MYNRKQLCLLAGVALEAFKEAQRVNPETGVDDLPFLSHDGHGDAAGDSGSRRYARYTPLDVLMVACAAQLSSGGGYIGRSMSFATACKVITNNAFNIEAAVQLHQKGNKLRFIGYATLHGAWGTGGENVFGTLGQIEARLHRAEPIEFGNLYLVAPVTVLRQVFERAKQHNIEWDSTRFYDQKRGVQ